MELVTPGFGLIFWTTITFLLLVFLLGKFAWKPILASVKSREDSIKDALESADKARQEMSQLQSEHEELVRKAKEERDQILKEAKETKDKVVAEASQAAKKEAAGIMAKAQEEITRQKEQAFKELKSEIAELAVEAAAKILKTELQDADRQKKLVDSYLSETTLN